MTGRTPNLFFIGGMRCGSTTLNLILGQHPDIFMSPVKEPRFFQAEDMRQRAARGEIAEARAEGFAAQGRHRTPESYAALFEAAAGERWVGESSHYLYTPPVAQLIHDRCPGARILVSLRDPVARLISEYLYYRRVGRTETSFEHFVTATAELDDSGEIVGPRPGSRLRKGCQAELLAPWLEQFGPERLYPVFFEDLEARPLDTARAIYGWLGVDPGFDPRIVHTQKGGVPANPKLVKAMNARTPGLRRLKGMIPKLVKERLRAAIYAKTLTRPDISEDLTAKLRRYYGPDIARLQALTGRDLTAWRGVAERP